LKSGDGRLLKQDGSILGMYLTTDHRGAHAAEKGLKKCSALHCLLLFCFVNSIIKGAVAPSVSHSVKRERIQ
jgi:hypothetical protein